MELFSLSRRRHDNDAVGILLGGVWSSLVGAPWEKSSLGAPLISLSLEGSGGSTLIVTEV